MRYIVMRENGAWLLRDMAEMKDKGLYSNQKEARAECRKLNEEQGSGSLSPF